MHRNFMGYTQRQTDLMIGLGMSAISDVWQAFAQNEKSVEQYFADKNINHESYFEDDKEHFNQTFHKLIAQKFLKHLTKT